MASQPPTSTVLREQNEIQKTKYVHEVGSRSVRIFRHISYAGGVSYVIAGNVEVSCTVAVAKSEVQIN